MDVKTIVGQERDVVQGVFIAQKINAKVSRGIITPGFVMYPITLHPREKIERVAGAMNLVSLRVSNKRRAVTKARLSEIPLYVEVPSPAPRALDFELVDVRRHTLRAGRGYDFNRAADEVISFDTSPHILVAGITGSGKSVAVLNLILSLAWSTPPSECGIFAIDLKNDSIVPVADLPHVLKFAGRPGDADELVDRTFAEMERRRDRRLRNEPRLVLLIDELAQMSTDSLKTLSRITALGRSMRINVIGATQYPTTEILGGGAAKVNYTTRLVGMVPDATTASTATGRPGTGAEMLPGRGSFIRVEGPTVSRFQTFRIDETMVDEFVGAVADKWAGVPVATMQQRATGAAVRMPTATGATMADLGMAGGVTMADPVTAGLPGIFEQYYDGAGGFTRGGVMAAIRAVYGDEARDGGPVYQTQRADVYGRLQAWLAAAE